MIPKTIHYCWFGRNPKPELFEKCRKSWARYCPDYEIIEWTEENFDVSIHPYVKEAYDAEKWAFVTDFARLWIVYNYGGIYLDTDVELIRSMDDLLTNHAWFGFEEAGRVNTGLGFGAEKNNKVVGMMIAGYDNVHFLKDDGAHDLTTCPVRNTLSISTLIPQNEDYRTVIHTECAVFYPSEYFCPLSADGSKLNKTVNTYSIHWFTATWLDESEKPVHEYRLLKNKCIRYFGRPIGVILVRLIYLFRPQKRKLIRKYSKTKGKLMI